MTTDLSLFVAAVLVVAGVLAFEIGVSTAITEIVAGVLLALFVDVSGLTWLDFLAHFGMLGLMFMAGFEVDPVMARRTWRPSLAIGAASFLVPFAGVTAVCQWAFLFDQRTAMLVGIGLSTTSLALVYQFLREREILAEPAGQMLLAAAMVIDVLSMVSLALLFGNLGWATAIFVLAAVPTFWGLRRVGSWLFARYRGNVAEFELRVVLLLLVGLGFAGDHVGIHAAVVGFVAGLVMSEVIQDHGALEDKLKGIIFSFFAPVFFLRAGTQFDLGALGWSTVLVAPVLLVVAVGLKYASAWAGARWTAPTVAHVAGVLFNYRLTFGIITATVGLQEGLIDRGLFSTILLVVLVSALLPMFLLRDLPSELE